MDQLMLDVTGIEDVRVGTRWCSSAARGLCHLRRGAGGERRTITNELFSRLGARVEGRCFRQEA